MVPVRPHGNGGATPLLRSAVKAALHGSGLLAPARRLRDGTRALGWLRHNRRFLASGRGDGLPIPPARLRLLTTASPSVEWFIESGRAGAGAIRNLLEQHAPPLDRVERLLDFGCGCGRVLRHWAGAGIALHGCDYNPVLIQWCRRELPFARFDTNDLTPPLPYDEGGFDLVYALSVFTHLPETLMQRWLAELARVVAPDGHLVISTHGDAYLDTLTTDERARYRSGELVVRNDQEPGSNRCGVFCSPDTLRCRVARHFTVIDHRRGGALGNPPQDLVLLRPAREGATAS